MSKYFAESELIINEDGSCFHLHLRPEQVADKVILVGDIRSSCLQGLDCHPFIWGMYSGGLGRIHAYLPDMAGYLFGMFPDGITTWNFWQILACTDYSIGKSNSFHLYTGIHNITQIATYQQIGIHFHFYSICINDRTVRMVVLRCILLV